MHYFPDGVQRNNIMDSAQLRLRWICAQATILELETRQNNWKHVSGQIVMLRRRKGCHVRTGGAYLPSAASKKLRCSDQREPRENPISNYFRPAINNHAA